MSNELSLNVRSNVVAVVEVMITILQDTSGQIKAEMLAICDDKCV